MRDTYYRTYVTDALQVICENTARFAGGKQINKRYVELVNPQKKVKKDTRTPEEITADIVKRIAKKDGE